MSVPSTSLLLSLLTCLALVTGCDRGETPGRSRAATSAKPNILLVVWDTVRADHLSLYGHHRATTPYLDTWAQGARVYADCVSASNTTVPAHASIFTGLLPTEHGVTNEEPYLSEQFVTLAELLRLHGYRTYLFSENPHICERNSFTQGFDLAEYPWSKQYVNEAVRITLGKLLPQDRSNELAEKFRNRAFNQLSIKAAGALAQKGVENWLSKQDRRQPFFIFLNYMETHRPLIPLPRYRQKFMTPEQVAASYHVDRRWVPLWSFVFGLRSYTPQELELTGATYDAALLELDELFHDLLQSLNNSGHLENTVVVLVSDHGEHLGEHHLLDHQFSVYEPLMKVPLAVHYPPRFAPGVDRRPVTNMDLFPALLELAGIDPPPGSKAVSLLEPREPRPRLGECPAVMRGIFEQVRNAYPNFDATPWDRTLRAYYAAPYKLIQASDGRDALYDLEQDPGELHNLIPQQPQLAQRLAADLQGYLDSLQKITIARPSTRPGPVDEDHRRRLEALGYVEPTSQPNGNGARKPGAKRP